MGNRHATSDSRGRMRSNSSCSRSARGVTPGQSRNRGSPGLPTRSSRAIVHVTPSEGAENFMRIKITRPPIGKTVSILDPTRFANRAYFATKPAPCRCRRGCRTPCKRSLRTLCRSSATPSRRPAQATEKTLPVISHSPPREFQHALCA